VGARDVHDVVAVYYLALKPYTAEFWGAGYDTFKNGQ
jgi:hypothetical protein